MESGRLPLSFLLHTYSGIFESANCVDARRIYKENLCIQKRPDLCGRGLISYKNFKKKINIRKIHFKLEINSRSGEKMRVKRSENSEN